MVDIESIADCALDKLTTTPATVQVEKDASERASPLLPETDSETGSVFYQSESEDDDQLLRYLVGNKSNKTDHDYSAPRPKSRDSGHFSGDSSSVYSNRKLGKRSRNESKTLTTVTIVDDSGKTKCYEGPNRNAVMAKLNRQRKKKQMAELESTVNLLTTENTALKEQNVCLRDQVHKLAKELKYVKGVLANQSELAGLLKNIEATGLEFHSSMSNNLRSNSDPTQKSHKRKCRDSVDELSQCENNAKALKTVDSSDVSVKLPSKCEAAGVCLHVSKGAVSLEFCSKCSEKAKSASRRDSEISC